MAPAAQKVPTMEVFNPNLNINFLGLRKISLAVSALLIVLSIGAILTRGLNYGLDFTGGLLVEAQYQQPVDVSEVRAALEAGGFEHAVVQSIGGAREVSIRLQVTEKENAATATQDNSAAKTDSAKQPIENTRNRGDEVAAAVLKALQAKRQDVTTKPFTFVGPQVGEELKSDGVTAVLVVILGIMIYIGIRFEWRFAVAAIASEIHDTLITVGFY